MSEIAKSKVVVDGNTVHVSMPFSKVDKQNRLVSGFATLDNVDTQGDIVLVEASSRAFARARGNIREMHQPLAVGRMVDFKEREYYEDGKIYRGIYVTARVSEGAENTWKKCLDGTLSGFSIGGEINKASNGVSKDAGINVRYIEDYDLTELSLVDNPANQLSNFDKIEKSQSVLSFTKSADGAVTATGMAVDTKIENVFVCTNHEDTLVELSGEESVVCPSCDCDMDNAGWFESGTDRTQKASKVVYDFLTPTEVEAVPNSDEGGVAMSKNNEEVSEEVQPESAGTEEETETLDEVTETPEEVEDEESEVSKKMDELHKAITDSLNEAREETQETVLSLEKKVDEVKVEFTEKFSELEEKMNGFGTRLEASKNRLVELENALEKINSSDAVRKSVDLSDEPTVEIVQKGTSWNGAFSGKRSTRFSVDDLT